ncbi:hypothetical protein [Dyella acidisoli]|uniref:Uncharacterized protein n=1 Tax=Dyella acidisoli TaxID=1867834 RepID=A0ABQ5XVP0_9GAMM|nr:hypothetical protein [Dyella acidisoli]GLQ94453.1 hypothetical protein GCM10007901_34050 [Dyella acidisoli]
MSDIHSDFDTAKAISDLLKEKDKDRQNRILRWVAESLEISFQSPTPATPNAATANAPTGPGVGETFGLPKSAPDIKTFMENKKPRSDVQFATATAYYYRFESSPDQRKDSISAEVLQDAARLVGRQRFVQPLMTLNNAKNQGYIDQVSRGAYRINSVGENLVAMTLPNTGENAAVSKRAAKKRAPTGKRKDSVKRKR